MSVMYPMILQNITYTKGLQWYFAVFMVVLIIFFLSMETKGKGPELRGRKEMGNIQRWK